MRLINGNQADFQGMQEPLESGQRKTFRCDVEDLESALLGLVLDLGRFLGRESTVQQSGGYAVGPQTVHLVFHQGDERRHHQGQAFEVQGRQLVAERLPAACWH